MSQPSPAVGVGCIVRRTDGRVLLMKRQGSHGPGSWSTPGGYLDYGESFEDCAIREVKEETGVVVSGVRFHAVTNDVFLDAGKHFVTVWMAGDYDRGDLVASEEADELGWFDPKALPEPRFLSFENLLSKTGL